jgi:hypothetical protein
MSNELWIHIRKCDLFQALYINGRYLFDDDVLLAEDVLDRILPFMQKDTVITFTVDEVSDAFDLDDDDGEAPFPTSIEKSDIGKFWRG